MMMMMMMMMKWDIHENPIHISLTKPHDRAKYSIVFSCLFRLRFMATDPEYSKQSGNGEFAAETSSKQVAPGSSRTSWYSMLPQDSWHWESHVWIIHVYNVYMYMYMYICIYIYLFIYLFIIYLYIHTYIMLYTHMNFPERKGSSSAIQLQQESPTKCPATVPSSSMLLGLSQRRLGACRRMARMAATTQGGSWPCGFGDQVLYQV